MPVPEKLRRFFDFIGTLKKRWSVGAAVLVDDTPDNVPIDLPANQYQIDLRTLWQWQTAGIPQSDLQGGGGVAVVSWAGIESKPTTLDGFGITDALSQGDLSGFAPLQDPVFSGVPKAPTAAAGGNSLQLANTAYVRAEIIAAGGFAGGGSSGGGSSGGTVEWQAITGKPETVADSGLADAVCFNDLSIYAPTADPIFTGQPQVPTPAAASNDAQIASTAFVKTAIAGLSTGGGTSGAVGFQFEYIDVSKVLTAANMTTKDWFFSFGANGLRVDLPLSGTRDGAEVWFQTYSKTGCAVYGAITDIDGVNTPGLALAAIAKVLRFKFIAQTGRWYQL